jgi:hypothetical protein
LRLARSDSKTAQNVMRAKTQNLGQIPIAGQGALT